MNITENEIVVERLNSLKRFIESNPEVVSMNEATPEQLVSALEEAVDSICRLDDLMR